MGAKIIAHSILIILASDVQTTVSADHPVRQCAFNMGQIQQRQALAHCAWSYHQRSKPMIVWIPIAVNEKPLLRGKIVIPEYSAAVIGSSVVLRVYGGGLTGLSYALTTIPFPTPEAAAEWIEANKFDMAYSAKLGVAPG